LLALSAQAEVPAANADVQKQAQPIIGGTVATPGTHPWIAALVSNGTTTKNSQRQFCGGALIDPSWVITAAHCLDDTDVNSFKVFIGRDDLDGTGGEVIAASQIIQHPYWQGYDIYDIAMVRLSTPSQATPIALSGYSIDQALFGSLVDLVGWGNSDYVGSYQCNLDFTDAVTNKSDYACETVIIEHGTHPNNLQQAKLTLEPYTNCESRYNSIRAVQGQKAETTPSFSDTASPDILCAWDETDTQSPCHGDSGGPLTAVVNSSPVLLGIVNLGIVNNCALPLQIGIYTRVSHYINFIHDSMGRNLSLEFSSLCPVAQRPVVSYGSLGGGKYKVTATWTQDAQANGYRLYYSVAQTLGQNISKVEMAADTTQLAVTLDSGMHFYIAVQGKGTVCDGPMSDLAEVTVP
ncbi:MAG TPA: serine protease, partial [Candidatus Acidoferrum sp.]|nr:serine protease [Candidatus Acidoferrum sp.]